MTLAVLADVEVLHLQSGDRAALAIGHDDVEVNEIDALEGGRLGPE
jgi:hypothetical protein